MIKGICGESGARVRKLKGLIMRKKKLAVTVCVTWVLLMGGCGDQDNSSEPTKKARTIGPQFYAYQLPEYETSEHDIMHGPGGRWLTIRKTLKEGIKVDPGEIRDRISKALEDAGWEAKRLPTQKYVLSKIFETSPEDLYYSHDAFPGDPPQWFYNQAIHIGADGEVIVLYCEAGW